MATAAALLVFFWRDWIAIVGGLFTSARYRRVSTPPERLAWLIVLATIPVGVAGLALEHLFRTTLGMSRACGSVSGRQRCRALRRGATAPPRPSAPVATAHADSGLAPPDERIAELPMAQGVLIGSAQILALLPGISRSGITMVAGLWRGLNHEEAARFSFLLATPVILAAGLLKIPDLFGPLGQGIGWQVLAGSVASFVAAYLAVRYLIHYFETRTLTPFAIYCTVAGLGSLAFLLLR